jgi:hypothetical protein
VAAAGLHRSEERVDWRPRKELDGARTGPAVSAADLAEGIARGSKAPAPATPSQAAAAPPTAGQDDIGKTASGEGKPRRRSRGGRKHKKPTSTTVGEAPTPPTESEMPAAQTEVKGVPAGAGANSETATDQAPKKPSRRRRGGRKHRKPSTGGTNEHAQDAAGHDSTDMAPAASTPGSTEGSPSTGSSRRRRPRRPRKKTGATNATAESKPSVDASPSEPDPFAY